MPARPLRRPHLGQDDARQPAATVVRFDGLCTGLRSAPRRPAAYPVRPRQLRHNPPQALEDRCPGANQRAPHQTRHALGFPLPGRVPRRPCPACGDRQLKPGKAIRNNDPEPTGEVRSATPANRVVRPPRLVYRAPCQFTPGKMPGCEKCGLAMIREWYWDFGPTLAAEKLREVH